MMRGHRLSSITPACVVLAAIILSINLSGCGGDRSGADTFVSNGNTATGWAGLPAPSALRGSSYLPEDLQRDGAEFLRPPEFTSNLAGADGAACVLSPAWGPGHHPGSDLAFAGYGFNLADYDRPHTVTFTLAESGVAGDFWVGLADWGRDCWDWHQPVDDLLETDLTPYIQSGTGTLLLVTACTGTAVWRLESVEIGAVPDVSGVIVEADGETPVDGVAVTLEYNDGLQPALEAVTGADGGYMFCNVADGNFTVTPALAGWVFTPEVREGSMAGADVVLGPFSATRESGLHTMDGYIYLNGTTTPIEGVGITISVDGTGYKAETDATGYWSHADLPDGSFYIIPGKTDWVFNPMFITGEIAGADLTMEDIYGGPRTLAIDGYAYEEGTTTPVVGVLVVAHWGDLSLGDSTDETGHYQIAVNDAAWRVSIASCSWDSDPEYQDVDMGGQSRTMEPFYLTPGSGG